MKKQIKLGIVGHPSSGKDTVAEHLEKNHGFRHISTGDFIREHIADNKLGDPKRSLMQSVGNEMRKRHGHDILVRKALGDKENHLVISGIRVIAEAETLKKEGGHIIVVHVDQEIRYERAKTRGRVGDNITLEKFIEQEEIEAKNLDNDPEAQNVNAVIEMADFIVHNHSTKEDLQDQLDQIIQKLKLTYE